MGDFNCPDICWEANSTKYGPSKKFLAYIAYNFLLQKEQEETRGVVILDLILTNRDDLVEEVTVRETLEESNHIHRIIEQ